MSGLPERLSDAVEFACLSHKILEPLRPARHSCLPWQRVSKISKHRQFPKLKDGGIGSSASDTKDCGAEPYGSDPAGPFGALPRRRHQTKISSPGDACRLPDLLARKAGQLRAPCSFWSGPLRETRARALSRLSAQVNAAANTFFSGLSQV